VNIITIIGLILVLFATVGLVIFPLNKNYTKKSLIIRISICSLFLVIGTALSSIVGPQKSADKKDLEYRNEAAQREIEYTDNISEFSKKLEIVIQTLNISDSTYVFERSQINRINLDFEKWAKAFIKNKDSLYLNIQKVNLNIKENDLLLNNRWRPYYVNLFEFMKNMLDAYNKEVKEKLIFRIPFVPDNISALINSTNWSADIDFLNTRKWHISFYTFPVPVNRPDLPMIYLYDEDYGYWDAAEAIFSINPNTNELIVTLGQDDIKIPDFKSKYSLIQNPNALQEVFQRLIEYELASN